jgi:hypothetical protein
MKNKARLVFETMPAYTPSDHGDVSPEVNAVSIGIARWMIESMGFEAREVPCKYGTGIAIATDDPKKMDEACTAYEFLGRKCWSNILSDAATRCIGPDGEYGLDSIVPALYAACDGARSKAENGDISGALLCIAKFRAPVIRERTL